jgi:hypothetical protein
MKGIYFINERISLNGLSRDESFALQERTIKKFLQEQKIQVVKLNPYQLHAHYSIPHALLYDLKKEKIHLDCLVSYSPQVLDDFIYSYPAKWLILKSFFKEVITVEEKTDLTVKEVI